MSRGGGCGEAGEVGVEGVVDLAGDVALEAADDFGLGLALAAAALGVGAGAGAVAQAADRDHVEGAVGVAVAAVVEPVAGRASAAGRDRAGAAERGKRGLAVEAVDVFTGGDE